MAKLGGTIQITNSVVFTNRRGWKLMVVIRLSVK